MTTETKTIQYCEDCVHCIREDGIDRPHYLSMCSLEPVDHPDSRVSRNEKPEEEFRYCSVVRLHDDCENYEAENLHPENDPRNDTDEDFKEYDQDDQRKIE